MSSVVPDGTNTPLALEGGPSISTGGNTLAPASMYVKDGNDVTLGLTTQTKATDGSTTSWSVVQLLKGIFDRLINSSIAVTGTFWQTTQPVSGTVTSNAGTNLNTSALALETGGNLATLAGAIASAIMQANTKQINGVTPLMGNGVSGTGSQRVNIASDNTAFSVNAIESGTWTVQPGNTANTTPWLVQTVAGTSGGSTPFHALSAASNNSTSLKGSAGLLYGYSISNTTASIRWVKFYNKASAPAPATDTVVWAEQIPANATVIATFPEGMGFATGIAFAAVANASDTDNTSIGAADLSIDIRYK